MSGFTDDFEKRFTSSWFSAGWVELQPVSSSTAEVNISAACHKNLQSLQEELEALKSDVENISFKQMQLANLAKFYQ